MIFHERAAIYSTNTAPSPVAGLESVPCEVSYGSTTTETPQYTTTEIPITAATFYGRNQAALEGITSSSVIEWRGRRFSILASPETHYVKGRLSHWEVKGEALY